VRRRRDDLAGGGVEDVEPFAVDGVEPGAIDVVAKRIGHAGSLLLELNDGSA
jgi:hypothetical protein